MSSNINIDIEISDDAMKVLMASVVLLGVGYLVYKVFENLPENEIPLPQEAKEFSELPEVSPETVDELGFSKTVTKRTEPLLTKELWVEAARESAVALYDVIRQRSGVQEDSTTLVRSVFRGTKRVLKFVNIAPEHIKNADEGLIHYLEAFSTHTRKIHMHASVSLSRKETFLIVNMAAFLAEQVEKKTVLANTM